MEVEAKLKAIADEAKATRKRPTRASWVAALVISAVSIVALVIGFLVRPDETPAPGHHPSTVMPPSFWSGLVIGLGCGVIVGWMLHRRAPD